MPTAIQSAVAFLLVMNLLTGCAVLQGSMPDTMSDAQLVTLLNTIDRTEIAAARLATQKAVSQPVRYYAARLLQEHAALLSQREQILTGSDLSPEKAALADKLEADSNTLLRHLNAKSGLEFDRAYIEAQIAKHDRAVWLAQETTDSTRDPLVSEQLRDVAPELQAHFARARSVRQQLVLTPPQMDQSQLAREAP